MKLNIQNRRVLAGLSLLVALPAACFTCISVLKPELGIAGPFDAAAPIPVQMGLARSTGWNTNLLILFGPFVAFLLVLFRVLTLRLQFTKNHFLAQALIKKKWLPLLVAAFSVSLLAILFVYLGRDNAV